MAFVNVVSDAGAHSIVLDTVVAVSERHQGMGIKLAWGAWGWMRMAARRLRGASATILVRRLRIQADPRRPHQPAQLSVAAEAAHNCATTA